MIFGNLILWSQKFGIYTFHLTLPVVMYIVDFATLFNLCDFYYKQIVHTFKWKVRKYQIQDKSMTVGHLTGGKRKTDKHRNRRTKCPSRGKAEYRGHCCQVSHISYRCAPHQRYTRLVTWPPRILKTETFTVSFCRIFEQEFVITNGQPQSHKLTWDGAVNYLSNFPAMNAARAIQTFLILSNSP